MATLARAPELVDNARRTGSNIGFVTDRFVRRRGAGVYVEFVDEMLAGTPFKVLAEFFPNFETLDKYAVLDAFERIYHDPVRRKDLLTSVGHSRKMAKRIPGARLVEATGAGHMVILEQFEGQRVLQELLDQAEGRDAA